MSENGFEDALRQMKTLVDVNESVAMESLEDAAIYFVNQLKPLLSVSSIDKEHMVDGLTLKMEKEKIVVFFENHAFYWYMVEHGHRKPNGRGHVRGKHTIKNTIEKESSHIEELMLKKITKKMGF